MKSNTKLILGVIICAGIVGAIVNSINNTPDNNNSYNDLNNLQNNGDDNGYYEDSTQNVNNNNSTSDTESARDKFNSLMNDLNSENSNNQQNQSSNNTTENTTVSGNRFNNSTSSSSTSDKKESGVTIVHIGGDKTNNSQSTNSSTPTVKPSVPSTNTNTTPTVKPSVPSTNTKPDTNTNVNTNTTPTIKPSTNTSQSTKVALDTTGDYSGLRLKRQSDRNDFTLHNLNKSKINKADSLTGAEKPLIVAVNAFNAYKNRNGEDMAKLHYPNTRGAEDASITENPFVAYKVLGYEQLPDDDVEKLNDSFKSAKKLYGYNFDIIATEYYRITMEIYQYEPTEPNHSPYPNYEADPYYFTALVYKADNSYYLHSFMTAK